MEAETAKRSLGSGRSKETDANKSREGRPSPQQQQQPSQQHHSKCGRCDGSQKQVPVEAGPVEDLRREAHDEYTGKLDELVAANVQGALDFARHPAMTRQM